MSRGILISAVVVALVAGAAFATPTITYSLSLNAVYTNNSDTTTVPLNASQLAAAAPGSLPVGYDYDLQLSVTVTGMTAGENFDNLLGQFNSNALLGGAANTSVFADIAPLDYAANTNIPAVKIGKNSFAFFSSNSATGTPAKYIFVAIAPNVAAAVDPADGVPVVVGDVWVNWDGTTASLATVGGAAGFNNMSTWENNAGNTGTTGQTLAYGLSSSPGGIEPIISNGVQFGAPEPATMALLAIGGIGALLRRRK